VKLRLIAAGTRMPSWVDAGFADYAARLPRECRLELTEIPLSRYRRSGDVGRAVRDEGERMLALLSGSDQVVSLDVRGKAVDSAGLAGLLDDWMHAGMDVALLIGGPDGLAPACSERSCLRWSLSPLTLPHGLVRIVVAEQLYRAWSILKGHPYHRE
jgi:23S rRNA (pseudouridine1915-N3)-methyltransferase